ncbi:hypothetical protein RhiLY_09943 [Ceratobasidium sp. AG-Ba]|nr:hypothetical protein RhiLY_09943 [Ceratobasidium sp. AG-Ba]
MCSVASTLRSASLEEMVVDGGCQTCMPGNEPPIIYSPASSPSPSPPPSDLKDFEYIGFLPGYPADLVILTRDESERWFAHRDILKFAKSEELVRLFRSPSTTVYLDVPSGAVRTLLEWVYPHTSMHITTFNALDAAFFISIVYKLDAMRDSLRALFDQPDCPVRISVDPICAYSVASKYGFRFDAREAAKLAIGAMDFMAPGALEKMARKGVSPECAFRLVQRQLAWERVLGNVLLKMPIEVDDVWACDLTTWVSDEDLRLMACGECVERAEAGSLVRMADWQRRWAAGVHRRLACTPFEKCDNMFQVDYVARGFFRRCEGCLVHVIRNPQAAERWVKKIWKALRESWMQIFDAV